MHRDDDNQEGGSHRNNRYGDPEAIEPVQVPNRAGHSFWSELFREAWNAAGQAAKETEEARSNEEGADEPRASGSQTRQPDPAFTFEDTSGGGRGFVEALIKSVLLAIFGSILGTVCRMLIRQAREFLWPQPATA